MKSMTHSDLVHGQAVLFFQLHIFCILIRQSLTQLIFDQGHIADTVFLNFRLLSHKFLDGCYE